MMLQPEVPSPDEVTADWWEHTKHHRFMIQQCQNCQHFQHPPRAVCTECSSMNHLELVEASGRGEVDTFTVVYRAPRAEIDVPYTLARVRLTEGPILLTQLLGNEAWVIGDPVQVDWVEVPDGRALPIFRKLDDSYRHI